MAAIVNEKGEFKQEPKMVDAEAEEFQDEIDELEAELGEDGTTWKTKEFILDHVDLRKRLVPARLHDSVRILPEILRDPTYDLDAALKENDLLQEQIEVMRNDSELYAKGQVVNGYKWEEIRVIPGTNIEIMDLTKDDKEIDPSWEEGFDPDAEVYPGDTIQYDVEYESYTPMLTEPPFPPSVLSELQIFNSRNAPINRIKPSILSNREAKFAQIEAQKILREEKMKTPLQEIKERRLEIEKQALEKRRLSDDELFAKLGAAMQKTLVSSGPNNRTEQYLTKTQEEKDTRAAKRAERAKAAEEAAWNKKIEAENKKRLEPSEMKGNLRYEKVVDFWPTDPKAREAQRATRRAEREAALVAEALILQLKLTKSNLAKEQNTLAAKVQDLQAEIAKTEAKRDLQKKGRGNHARPAVLKRVSRLQDKLEKETSVVSTKTKGITQKTLALDKQVEAAERMKRDIVAQANEATKVKEAEKRANSWWY